MAAMRATTGPALSGGERLITTDHVLLETWCGDPPDVLDVVREAPATTPGPPDELAVEPVGHVAHLDHPQHMIKVL